MESQMESNDFTKFAGEGISKYTYFILASSTAAITYSFNKAELSSLSFGLTFFAVAIFSWSLSFYFGCKSIEASLSVSITLANDEVLQNNIKKAQKFLEPQHFADIQASYNEGLSNTNVILKRDSFSSGKYLKIQFKLLLLGSISFILWQSAELVMRLSKL
jgi:hypothetical protein